MSVKREVNTVRTCDVCGKTEGLHLKSSDFFDDPPCVVIKNHDGIEMAISIYIDVTPYDQILNDGIIDDVVDSYMDIHGQKIMPTNMMQFIPIIQQQNMPTEPAEATFVVCKACHKCMTQLVSTYGKFDKIEVF